MDKAANFKQNLAKINLQETVKWAQHRVEPGETLGYIAQRYNTPVSAIRKINKISDATILSGESLIIPVSVGNTKATQGEKLEHTVEQGDTFWDLAHKYDVSINHIAEWNSMTPEDLLIPGQTLVIWQNTNQASNEFNQSLVRTRFTAPPKRSTMRKINYRVRDGESLSLISRKFQVSLDDLREWNSLADEPTIRPGQYLKLYVDVTRFSGKI